MKSAFQQMYENRVRQQRRRDTDDEDDDYEEVKVSKRDVKAIQTFSTIISIFVTVLAVYLSWSVNTVSGEPILIKVLYALIAGLFGPFYLIYFILVSKDVAELRYTMKELSARLPASAESVVPKFF